MGEYREILVLLQPTAVRRKRKTYSSEARHNAFSGIGRRKIRLEEKEMREHDGMLATTTSTYQGAQPEMPGYGRNMVELSSCKFLVLFNKKNRRGK